MNALVKLERSGFTEDGMREYTFTTSSALKIDKDKTYVLDLSEKKPKRSLAQNDMFNSILNKICLESDGNLKDRDVYYGQLLKMAGIEEQTNTGIYTADELEQEMKLNDYRTFDVISKSVINHVMYYKTRFYKGSSKFNSAQMSRLIDVTLDYAAELGIETDYWRSLLNV